MLVDFCLAFFVHVLSVNVSIRFFGSKKYLKGGQCYVEMQYLFLKGFPG